MTEACRIPRRLTVPAWVLASTAACLLVTGSGAQTIQLDSRDLLKKASGLAPQAAPTTTGQTALEAPPSPDSTALAPPQPASPQTAASAGKVNQGYLYVDAFQTRFEFLIDARRLLHWLNPSEDAPAVLDAAAQQAAIKAVRKQVEGWCRLGVGGLKIDGTLTGISVIKGRPGATLPMQPDEKVKVDEAMFGFMWDFATPPVPDEIIVEWRGFIEDIQKLPIRVFFGSRSEDLDVNAFLPRCPGKARAGWPCPRRCQPFQTSPSSPPPSCRSPR